MSTISDLPTHNGAYEKLKIVNLLLNAHPQPNRNVVVADILAEILIRNPKKEICAVFIERPKPNEVLIVISKNDLNTRDIQYFTDLHSLFLNTRTGHNWQYRYRTSTEFEIAFLKVVILHANKQPLKARFCELFSDSKNTTTEWFLNNILTIYHNTPAHWSTHEQTIIDSICRGRFSAPTIQRGDKVIASAYIQHGTRPLETIKSWLHTLTTTQSQILNWFNSIPTGSLNALCEFIITADLLSTSYITRSLAAIIILHTPTQNSPINNLISRCRVFGIYIHRIKRLHKYLFRNPPTTIKCRILPAVTERISLSPNWYKPLQDLWQFIFPGSCSLPVDHEDFLPLRRWPASTGGLHCTLRLLHSVTRLGITVRGVQNGRLGVSRYCCNTCFAVTRFKVRGKLGMVKVLDGMLCEFLMGLGIAEERRARKRRRVAG